MAVGEVTPTVDGTVSMVLESEPSEPVTMELEAEPLARPIWLRRPVRPGRSSSAGETTSGRSPGAGVEPARRAATATETDPYWRVLVEINRPRLVGACPTSSTPARCSNCPDHHGPGSARAVRTGSGRICPFRAGATLRSDAPRPRPDPVGADPLMQTVGLIVFIAVAVGFDFTTNGFHDAANAVAAPITTRAIQPMMALGRGAQRGRRPGVHAEGRGHRRRGHHHDRARHHGLVVVSSAARRDPSGNLITWWFGLPVPVDPRP